MNKNRPDFETSMLPHNRLELYFDVIHQQWRKLLGIGLLILLFALPLLLLSFGQELSIASLRNMVEAGKMEETALLNALLRVQLEWGLLYLIALPLLFLGISGMATQYRSLLWEEPLFFWHDFRKGIKGGGFSMMGQGLLLAIFLYAASAGFYALDDIFRYVPLGLLFFFIFPASLQFVIQSPLYQDRFGGTLKNAILLAIKEAPLSWLFSLLFLSPCFLLLVPNPFLRFGLVAVILVFGFPFIGLAFFDVGFWWLDKDINKKHYPELVDKGLHRN